MILGVFVFTSCEFSSVERKRIYSGDGSEKMRLFIVDNHTDSILLRKDAKPVGKLKNNKAIKHLTNRMLATVTDTLNPGVGIAAPQVGISKRLICVQRLDKPNEPFEFYINPKYEPGSDETKVGREGCLSVPGYWGTVPRFTSICLEYYDLEGKKHKETINGFTAIIFQHEIDHLNGVLYYDRVERDFQGLKIEG